MNSYEIIRLVDNPHLKDKLAIWFHEKWDIPTNAYLDSMNESIGINSSVPKWYAVIDNNKIIGGIGVIENDFHDRKDLTPNICGLYVEENYRCKGIAGQMLKFVCNDMENYGINTLYLLTDHNSFYERYDWKFLCMVNGAGEECMARMYIHKMN